MAARLFKVGDIVCGVPPNLDYWWAAQVADISHVPENLREDLSLELREYRDGVLLRYLCSQSFEYVVCEGQGVEYLRDETDVDHLFVPATGKNRKAALQAIQEVRRLLRQRMHGNRIQLPLGTQPLGPVVLDLSDERTWPEDLRQRAFVPPPRALTAYECASTSAASTIRSLRVAAARGEQRLQGEEALWARLVYSRHVSKGQQFCKQLRSQAGATRDANADENAGADSPAIRQNQNQSPNQVGLAPDDVEARTRPARNVTSSQPAAMAKAADVEERPAKRQRVGQGAATSKEPQGRFAGLSADGLAGGVAGGRFPGPQPHGKQLQQQQQQQPHQEGEANLQQQHQRQQRIEDIDMNDIKLDDDNDDDDIVITRMVVKTWAKSRSAAGNPAEDQGQGVALAGAGAAAPMPWVAPVPAVATALAGASSETVVVTAAAGATQGIGPHEQAAATAPEAVGGLVELTRAPIAAAPPPSTLSPPSPSEKPATGARPSAAVAAAAAGEQGEETREGELGLATRSGGAAEAGLGAAIAGTAGAAAVAEAGCEAGAGAETPRGDISLLVGDVTTAATRQGAAGRLVDHGKAIGRRSSGNSTRADDNAIPGAAGTARGRAQLSPQAGAGAEGGVTEPAVAAEGPGSVPKPTSSQGPQSPLGKLRVRRLSPLKGQHLVPLTAAATAATLAAAAVAVSERPSPAPALTSPREAAAAGTVGAADGSAAAAAATALSAADADGSKAGLVAAAEPTVTVRAAAAEAGSPTEGPGGPSDGLAPDGDPYPTASGTEPPGVAVCKAVQSQVQCMTSGPSPAAAAVGDGGGDTAAAATGSDGTAKTVAADNANSDRVTAGAAAGSSRGGGGGAGLHWREVPGLPARIVGYSGVNLPPEDVPSGLLQLLCRLARDPMWAVQRNRAVRTDLLLQAAVMLCRERCFAESHLVDEGTLGPRVEKLLQLAGVWHHKDEGEEGVVTANKARKQQQEHEEEQQSEQQPQKRRKMAEGAHVGSADQAGSRPSKADRPASNEAPGRRKARMESASTGSTATAGAAGAAADTDSARAVVTAQAGPGAGAPSRLTSRPSLSGGGSGGQAKSAGAAAATAAAAPKPGTKAATTAAPPSAAKPASVTLEEYELDLAAMEAPLQRIVDISARRGGSSSGGTGAANATASTGPGARPGGGGGSAATAAAYRRPGAFSLSSTVGGLQLSTLVDLKSATAASRKPSAGVDGGVNVAGAPPTARLPAAATAAGMRPLTGAAASAAAVPLPAGLLRRTPPPPALPTPPPAGTTQQLLQQPPKHQLSAVPSHGGGSGSIPGAPGPGGGGGAAFATGARSGGERVLIWFGRGVPMPTETTMAELVGSIVQDRVRRPNITMDYSQGQRCASIVFLHEGDAQRLAAQLRMNGCDLLKVTSMQNIRVEITQPDVPTQPPWPQPPALQRAPTSTSAPASTPAPTPAPAPQAASPQASQLPPPTPPQWIAATTAAATRPEPGGLGGPLGVHARLPAALADDRSKEGGLTAAVLSAKLPPRPAPGQLTRPHRATGSQEHSEWQRNKLAAVLPPPPPPPEPSRSAAAASRAAVSTPAYVPLYGIPGELYGTAGEPLAPWLAGGLYSPSRAQKEDDQQQQQREEEMGQEEEKEQQQQPLPLQPPLPPQLPHQRRLQQQQQQQHLADGGGAGQAEGRRHERGRKGSRQSEGGSGGGGVRGALGEGVSGGGAMASREGLGRGQHRDRDLDRDRGRNREREEKAERERERDQHRRREREWEGDRECRLEPQDHDRARAWRRSQSRSRSTSREFELRHRGSRESRDRDRLRVDQPRRGDRSGSSGGGDDGVRGGAADAWVRRRPGDGGNSRSRSRSRSPDYWGTHRGADHLYPRAHGAGSRDHDAAATTAFPSRDTDRFSKQPRPPPRPLAGRASREYEPAERDREQERWGGAQRDREGERDKRGCEGDRHPESGCEDMDLTHGSLGDRRQGGGDRRPPEGTSGRPHAEHRSRRPAGSPGSPCRGSALATVAAMHRGSKSPSSVPGQGSKECASAGRRSLAAEGKQGQEQPSCSDPGDSGSAAAAAMAAAAAAMVGTAAIRQASSSGGAGIGSSGGASGALQQLVADDDEAYVLVPMPVRMLQQGGVLPPGVMLAAAAAAAAGMPIIPGAPTPGSNIPLMTAGTGAGSHLPSAPSTGTASRPEGATAAAAAAAVAPHGAAGAGSSGNPVAAAAGCYILPFMSPTIAAPAEEAGAAEVSGGLPVVAEAAEADAAGAATLGGAGDPAIATQIVTQVHGEMLGAAPQDTDVMQDAPSSLPPLLLAQQQDKPQGEDYERQRQLEVRQEQQQHQLQPKQQDDSASVPGIIAGSAAASQETSRLVMDAAEVVADTDGFIGRVDTDLAMPDQMAAVAIMPGEPPPSVELQHQQHQPQEEVPLGYGAAATAAAAAAAAGAAADTGADAGANARGDSGGSEPSSSLEELLSRLAPSQVQTLRSLLLSPLQDESVTH